MNNDDRKIKKYVYDEIKGKLKSSRTARSSGMFKVPPKQLDVAESKFLPEFFSFGPYHYKDLIMHHDLKICHLLRLFRVKVEEIDGAKKDEDNKSQSHKVSLGEVLNDMIALKEKTRECYNNIDDIEDEDLIEMMVVDGCFIVDLLRLYHKNTTKGIDEESHHDTSDNSGDSPIFATRWLLPSVLRDLMKLENQLPFFVLEKLFLVTASGNDEPSLQDLFVNFFCSMLSLDRAYYKLDPNHDKKYAHPLHLFRLSVIFPMTEKWKLNEDYKIFIDIPKLIYSAQELQEAGIVICKKDNSNLLDISFDSTEGTLEIPPLSIDENMIVALLNVVAYEQCDQSRRPFFINYLLFIDNLINTTKDVEILRKSGIIRYPLGTEKEVVDLFNNLCKEMLYSFDQTYLAVDMNAVNKYCKAYYDSKCRTWWSDLKKERFSSPWTFLSLVAAIVLLILTMLQTFYTIFPYYHSN